MAIQGKGSRTNSYKVYTLLFTIICKGYLVYDTVHEPNPVKPESHLYSMNNYLMFFFHFRSEGDYRVPRIGKVIKTPTSRKLLRWAHCSIMRASVKSTFTEEELHQSYRRHEMRDEILPCSKITCASTILRF